METCSICYEDFIGESPMKIPCDSKCTAKYHKKCLMRWNKLNPHENRHCLNCFKPFKKVKIYKEDLIHDFCWNDSFCIYLNIIQQSLVLCLYISHKGPVILDIIDKTLTKSEIELKMSTYLLYYSFGYFIPIIYLLYHSHSYNYYQRFGYFSYRLHFFLMSVVCFWTICYCTFQEYNPSVDKLSSNEDNMLLSGSSLELPKKAEVNYSYIFTVHSIIMYSTYILTMIRAKHFISN
jgi:hypothetical protein